LTLDGVLADGNYRLTLPAGWLRDAAGNPMAADFTFDFHPLAGDANRDRSVNFNDLTLLAQNYNTTGQSWATGDFTGDGNVDFNDLVKLAQNYNASLLSAPLPGLTASFSSDMAAAFAAAALVPSSKPASNPPTAPKQTPKPTFARHPLQVSRPIASAHLRPAATATAITPPQPAPPSIFGKKLIRPTRNLLKLFA